MNDGDSRPGWSLDSVWSTAPPGTHPFTIEDLARYERSGLLGEGGMGQVFAAHDRRLHREVALKVAVGRPGVKERLAQEAWITAQLEHPGIVPVYDAGETEDGRLFYTMRVIRGRSLAEALADSPDLGARLRWVRPLLAACQAVAYAHSRGIVHRDLKPANVLVGEFGETQVVDWGLARPLDQHHDDTDEDWIPDGHAVQTHFGAVVGTPAYMAPEQVSGEPCDARADVWSLGVALYELLCGRTPFASDDTAHLLARLANDEVPSLRDRAPDAPVELVAIVHRALQRDPDARYPTARELADDLERWVDGRRVHAYDYSSWELLGRLASRWRAPLAVGATAVVALSVLGAGAWVRTEQQRERAVAAEQRSRIDKGLADAHLVDALIAQARSAVDKQAIPEAELLAAWALTLEESPEARGGLALATAVPTPEAIDHAELVPCPQRYGGGPGEGFLCVTDGVERFLPDADTPAWAYPAQLGPLVQLPDVDRVVGIHHEPHLEILDRSDGTLLGTVPDVPAGVLRGAGRWALDANATQVLLVDASTLAWAKHVVCPGTRTATADLAADGRYVVLCHDGQLLSGKAPNPPDTAVATGFTRTDPLLDLRLSPDQRSVLVDCGPGELALLDVATGQTRWRSATAVGRTRELAWSPDGGRVLVVGERTGPELRDATTGAILARLPRGMHDGGFVGDALWTRGRRLTHWRIPPPAVAVFPGREGLTTATASPDGTRIATTHGGGGAHVFDVTTGALVADLRWHEHVTKWGAWSPDGRSFAASGIGEHGVRRFATDTWTSSPMRHDSRYYRRVGWLADGSLWGASYGEPTSLWEGDVPRYLEGEEPVFDGSSAPDHHAAVLLESGGRVLRLEPGGHVTELLTDPEVVRADLSDRDTLAVATRSSIRILDPGGRERLRIAPDEAPLDLRLSPDERWLVTSHLDGTARLWSTTDGSLRAVLRGHTERVVHVDFEPDGQRLLTASWDGSARRWSLAPLEADPRALLDDARRRWGMEPEDALATSE